MFLIDHIKNNLEIVREKSECPFFSQQDIIEKIKTAVSIDSQNIVEHLVTKENWKLTDAPYAKPPFPNIWVEYREPIITGDDNRIEKIYNKIQAFPYWGFLILTGDGKQKINDVMINCFLGWKRENKIIRAIHHVIFTFKTNKSGEIIKQYDGNTLLAKALSIFNDKRKSFDYVIYDRKEVERDGDPELLNDPAYMARLGNSYALHLISVLLTFSFMNCKNVNLEVIREAKNSVAGIWPGRYLKEKLPITKIYTLTIDPIKKIITSENNGNGAITPKALHICRGHFKDFSHGKGLFGKYKGTYWWPSQVRSKKEYGEVIKDYKIQI